MRRRLAIKTIIPIAIYYWLHYAFNPQQLTKELIRMQQFSQLPHQYFIYNKLTEKENKGKTLLIQFQAYLLVNYNYQQDMKGLFIIVVVLTIISSNCQLYQVVAIIGPGARYHINDLYDAKDYQAQWGQITPVGMRQQQNLGKLFRKQYVDGQNFLSKNFIREQYQICPLTINRTIQSALSNFYGMYPLGQGQQLNKVDPKYHIPPYAYKNDSSQQKYALPDGQLIKIIKYDSSLIENCPNQQIQIEKNIKQQITEYNEMVLTYTPFLRKVATSFGMDSSSMNFTKLAALYDTVNVDRYLGKSLPSGFSQDDFNNLQHLYNWYSHFTRSFNLSKAINTHKIDKILSLFDYRVKNVTGPTLRWTTISVDSLDIVALQNDLNISSALCIQQLYRRGSTEALNCQQGTVFASSIIFELHSNNGKDFYVRVRDNGKYINLCENKSQNCAYNEWRSRVSKIVIPNAQTICGKPAVNEKADILIE